MSTKSKNFDEIQSEKEQWESKNSPNIQKNMFQMYTPADIKDHDFLNDVGFPGQYPYVAGRYGCPSVAAMWGRGKDLGVGQAIKSAFGYSGCGTAEDLRDFYLNEGAHLTLRGPNIAFDLPTQCGLDSDDERCEGEVGKVGLAVDTLRDFETLYEVFTGPKNIDKVTSLWTINGTSNIIIAMYAALAQKRNIPLSSLKGTPQNDILKEFVARGTQIFPVKASMRMTRDTITYCTEHMPKMNTISISGYHMRELGATRIQTVAFTMANGLAYFKTALDAGLDIDDFVGRTTFLSYGGGMEILKEIAVRRAARRVWAKIMRYKLKAKKEKHWFYKEGGAVLVGYWTSTKQRPINNLVRATLGAVGSAFIGDPPMVMPPFDEPLGLGHSKEANQFAADAARIIVEESKLCDVQDPLAGSYYIENLTDKYEKEILSLLEQIEEMGGADKAVESGWMKKEVIKSSIAYERKMNLKEEVRIGINKYTESDEIEIIPKTTPMYSSIDRDAAEKKQIAILQKTKRERDNKKVTACLEKIENAAKNENENLIPFFIDAVKEYTTMGEICSALKNVFGSAI